MDQIPMKRISIQVSLSGYSFRIYEAGELVSCSGWIPSGEVESASELTGTYDQVLLSVMTPKITMKALDIRLAFSNDEFLNTAYTLSAAYWRLVSFQISGER